MAATAPLTPTAKYERAIKIHTDTKFRGVFTPAEITEFATHADTFISSIRAFDQGKETSQDLALLCLYDLAILIDDSSSMRVDEANNVRIRTLQQVLDVIRYIYYPSQLPRHQTIKSIQFLNNGPGKINVNETDFPSAVAHSADQYHGNTMIGTELKSQILTPLITSAMTRPLLVMIITDGDVEGEDEGYLKEVIMNCVTRLNTMTQAKPNFVSFQFSRVGNSADALKLLKELDDDPTLASYIDCQSADESFALDMSPVPATRLKQRNLITKLMIGALEKSWDRKAS